MTTNSTPETGAGAQRKSLLTKAAMVVGAAGLCAIVFFVLFPPGARGVRRHVRSYLAKHSTTGNFKVPFPFPSKEEMSKAPPGGDPKAPGAVRGKLTGKDFDTLANDYLDLKTAIMTAERGMPETETELGELKPRLERLKAQLKTAEGAALEVAQLQVTNLTKRITALERQASSFSQTDIQAKKTAIEPILSDLWDFQRAWQEEAKLAPVVTKNTLTKAREDLIADVRQRSANAKSYEVIYKAIGQELWVAETLLASANPEHQREGLLLALAAAYTAQDQARNGLLAAQITEGYIWPRMDLATDINRRSSLNPDTLLGECLGFLGQSDDPNILIRAYKTMLTSAKSTQQADQARYQLGVIYAQNQDLKEALSYFKQVKGTNNFRVTQQIRWVEQQLQKKK
jgi:hypothetical protein